MTYCDCVFGNIAYKTGYGENIRQERKDQGAKVEDIKIEP